MAAELQDKNTKAVAVFFRLNDTVDVRFSNGLVINYTKQNYQAYLGVGITGIESASISHEVNLQGMPVKIPWSTFWILFALCLIVGWIAPVWGVIAMVFVVVNFVIQRARYARFWRNARKAGIWQA